MNETVNIPNCDCQSDRDDEGSPISKVVCDVQKLDKGVKLFETRYVCGRDGRRRKRDVSGSTENIINLDDVLASVKPIDANYTPPPLPTWPTRNHGITEEQATSACHGGLQRSPAYEACKDKVDLTPLVRNCVTDIKVRSKLSHRH